MIEKDKESSKIHRLQVIHPYECALYMREMDQHCKDNYLLNKGFYKGRLGKRSINLVIIDLTQVEIVTITQQILVQFNNDATTCFNQIMSHIFFLCLQLYQMPVEFTVILGDLL